MKWWVLALLLASASATAEQVFSLTVGEGQLISLPQPAKTVFVANPSIADVKVPTPSKVFLSGTNTGSTTLFVLDAEGEVIIKAKLLVKYDVQTLSDILQQRFPEQKVVLEPGPGSMLVTGQVDTPETKAAVLATISQYMGEVGELIDRLELTTPTQVNLRVRIAEVSRDVNRRFGINWATVLNTGDFAVSLFTGRDFLDSSGGVQSNSSTFGSIGIRQSGDKVDLNGVLDALEQEQLLRILAEPNLTAISGESAQFLAGGEVGINSVGDSGAGNVTFKQYGVGLSFSPQVLSSNRIRLRIEPEVSQLAASSLGSTSAPTLEVRRMSTTVELVDGQSFVIGGLLQNNFSDAQDQLPGLGDLPILGSLFRSTAYSERKSELVIMVTPTIVGSTEGDSRTASLQPLTGVELIIANRLNGRKKGKYASGLYLPQSVRMEGRVGFVY